MQLYTFTRPENLVAKYIQILVPDKEQRYFYITITHDGDESQFEDYCAITRLVRKAVSTLGHLETLTDDVSLFYSTKAYERINKLENLLRKLISYFMFTNVGMNWEKETVPDEVRRSAINEKKSDPRQYRSFLERLDFIVLADFLFKAYALKSFDRLRLVFDDTEGSLDRSLIEPFVPRSNWDRYFSSIVNYSDKKLSEQWEALYELRCKIAHSAILNKDEYLRVIHLADELEIPIHEAIANIKHVNVPDEEKSTVQESVPTLNDVASANSSSLEHSQEPNSVGSRRDYASQREERYPNHVNTNMLRANRVVGQPRQYAEVNSQLVSVAAAQSRRYAEANSQLVSAAAAQSRRYAEVNSQLVSTVAAEFRRYAEVESRLVSTVAAEFRRYAEVESQRVSAALAESRPYAEANSQLVSAAVAESRRYAAFDHHDLRPAPMLTLLPDADIDQPP